MLCIEYFIGASPEFFTDDQDGAAYFETALEWLRARHGAENVAAWSIHRDETSPHLVAYVVPRVGDKLNAKHFLGGKAKLSAMQTDFAEVAGKPYGLERGIEGSEAEHVTIKAFYAGLKKGPVRPAKLSAAQLIPKQGETPQHVASRLSLAIRRHYEPAMQQAAAAALAKSRSAQMEATARAKAAEAERYRLQLEDAERKLQAIRALFVDGLNLEQRRELADLAAFMRETNPPQPSETATRDSLDRPRSYQKGLRKITDTELTPF